MANLWRRPSICRSLLRVNRCLWCVNRSLLCVNRCLWCVNRSLLRVNRAFDGKLEAQALHLQGSFVCE